MNHPKQEILTNIFHPQSIDDLSLTNGVDYRLLGLIWQNIVEKKITRNRKLLEEIIATDEYTLDFKYRALLSEMILPKLSKTSQDYFVFDGFIEYSKFEKLSSTIIEIKLGLQNIGIKEMEYLYYHPQSNMVCILFYPAMINQHRDIYETIICPLVDEFNEEYMPPEPLNVPIDRISFIGRSRLDLIDITEKKLREYQTRVDYYSKIVVQLLTLMYPGSLVKEDLLQLTEAHHEVIGSILRNLLAKSIITSKSCDILNSIDRISKDITLYTLNDDIYNDSYFQELRARHPLTLDRELLDTVPDRTCVKSEIRKNDLSILCYLSHYPKRWISVPDLLENVAFDSQGELRRRLEALVDQQNIETTQGYLIDLHKSKTRSYEGHFYRFIPDQHIDIESCSCARQPPSRIRSPVQLSLNELYILLFLSHHEISNACPIAISDLATALNIRPTTTLQAVKRLAESSFPLSTHDGWVLSRGGKITRMRSSPVVSLETPLSDELVDLADLHDLSVPDRCDRMVILSFPLTPNETAVVDAVIRGLDVEQICDQLTLNPIPKRNRSMITRIIKRLSDQDTMNKRGISPLLQQHPLALHSSADQQQLEVHIKAISSLDL